jgi:hypothetical protein
MTLPKGWPVPAALILLALIPVLGSVDRIADLGRPVTADSARFHAAPWAITLHAGGASLFLILGALQLLPGTRRGRWHVRAGRVAWAAGVVGVLAGLWMTLMFRGSPGNPDLLVGFRVVAGVIWLGSLILALAAIRSRDVMLHRAWMLRALAIGFGGGTSAIFLFPLFVSGIPISDELNTLVQAGSWALNLGLAERAIARKLKGVPA